MHIFLSYAKKDTYDLAIELATDFNVLPEISCWVDDRELEPGESWSRQIEQEIEKCDVMVVLISSDIHRDPNGEKGISFVLNELGKAQDLKKTIIPVLAIPTKIPLQIYSLQYIDFTKNKRDGKAKLIKYIKDLKETLKASSPQSKSNTKLQTHSQTLPHQSYKSFNTDPTRSKKVLAQPPQKKQQYAKSNGSDKTKQSLGETIGIIIGSGIGLPFFASLIMVILDLLGLPFNIVFYGVTMLTVLLFIGIIWSQIILYRDQFKK